MGGGALGAGAGSDAAKAVIVKGDAQRAAPSSELAQQLAEASDEIYLAIAPLLVGGGPRFLAPTQYPWPSSRRMQLGETSTIDDVVLLRYFPKLAPILHGGSTGLLMTVRAADAGIVAA